MIPMKENTKMSELFSGDQFQLFLDAIAEIESNGVYNIKGGSGNHYDGKYQLGRDAKIDAGRLLGLDLAHSEEARETFRQDPELQERAMRALVMSNHKALINKQGDAYLNLPNEEKLAILGYAHNQGAGGASKWMRSGESESDGFGTKGSRYASAIRYDLGTAGPEDYASVAYHGTRDIAREIKNMSPDVTKSFNTAYKNVSESASNMYDSAAEAASGLFGGVDHNSTPEFDEIGPQRFAYHIARDNNMTLDELQSLNPEQEITYGSQGTRMPAGLKLRVGGFENLS